mmetsp:Transcript_53470/g.98906  ORF Transcript_53470/g.98906 Transcript_53470/m.98906 type:complete len:96 (-) Transcript_53470:143-430(-)
MEQTWIVSGTGPTGSKALQSGNISHKLGHLMTEEQYPGETEIKFFGKDAYVPRLVAAPLVRPQPGKEVDWQRPQRLRPGLDELLAPSKRGYEVVP